MHYPVVCLMEKHGLKFSDSTPVYLAPAHGRTAFKRRKVDVWVIWEPF